MNKYQAWDAFWSSFGWKAYDVSTVPAEDFEPVMPRITYDVSMSEFDYPVVMNVSLWDRDFSWEDISLKEQEISERIGKGGVLVPYDGGAIWITRNTPFSQRLQDEDDAVRRILINVNAEFLSA